MLSVDVLPDEPIPAGSYLVHDHVRPQKPLSGNGFRAWIQTKFDNLVRCRSGISRSNRLTARGLAQFLHLFQPHATLLRRRDGALFKTGTIPGVRTLAGYADLPIMGERAS